MQLHNRRLIDRVAEGRVSKANFVSDHTETVWLDTIHRSPEAWQFLGKNVLLRTDRQLNAALALIVLDGIARRILICPADVASEQLPKISELGEVEVTIGDDDVPGLLHPMMDAHVGHNASFETEWILFTSGTSGLPKLVQHSLQSLIRPIGDGISGTSSVWGTFYDIRRYGGLQILLRALLTGASMVLSHQDEPVGSFLRRLNADRVTHLSGTPSHWRRAVMSGHASDIAPSYARLSGEVADQGVLDRLSALYPSAELTHAFATTEVGVAFTVTDGRAGFPEHFIGASDRPAQIKVSRGSLWVKSESMASRYLGTMALLSRDDEGFIDTGDMVEYLEGRLYFNGRREGVINIGGNKVYPEEVEAIINRHPAVLMSRVWGRSNPITGTLISADIVLSNAFAGDAPAPIQAEIIESCRQSLPPHKVPVSLKLVSDISMMSSGKVARRHA